ncbi:hypothetical protein EMCRGX_G011079 [Ephydatia muelleri]
MSYEPAFRGFSKVSGYAEIWDETDTKKLEQSGWRTGTNENAYSTDTLIGNWNEQRFDVTYISKRRSLPSQYDHCYETTSRKDYTNHHHSKPTITATHPTATVPKAFPGHQPFLDPQHVQVQSQQFMSTAMEAFGTPSSKCSVLPKKSV